MLAPPPCDDLLVPSFSFSDNLLDPFGFPEFEADAEYAGSKKPGAEWAGVQKAQVRGIGSGAAQPALWSTTHSAVSFRFLVGHGLRLPLLSSAGRPS